MKISDNISFIFLMLPILSIMSCSRNDTINYQFFQDGNWGIIDNTGKTIMENEFGGDISLLNEGVIIQKKKSGKYYFINNKGAESGNSYKAMTFFNNNVAFVIKENSYPIAINTDGDELKEIKVEEVSCFINGMARVLQDGLYGFINEDLELIIKPKYSTVNMFTKGGKAIVTLDDEKFIVDKSGDIVTKLKSDIKYYSISDEFIKYYDDGYGIVDFDGNKIIRPKEEWSDLRNFINGYASYKEDGLWGVINEKGEKTIRAKFENAVLFQDGLAAVGVKKEEGGRNIKYGYIDKSGEFIIEPEYDFAFPFFKGSALVKDGKYYYFIDKENKKSKEEFKKLKFDKFGLYYIENFNSSVGAISFMKVVSDYFDIEKTTSDIISSLQLTDNSVLSLNKLSGPSSAAYTALDIEIKDPSKISNYGYRQTYWVKGVTVVNDEIVTEVEVLFDQGIYTQAFKIEERYNYSKRKYVEEQVFSHIEFNDSSRIQTINVKINPKHGKARDKKDQIIEALNEHLKTTYKTVDIPNSGNKTWYKVSDNIATQLDAKSMVIRFKFL